jgi:hypothetical protein
MRHPLAAPLLLAMLLAMLLLLAVPLPKCVYLSINNSNYLFFSARPLKLHPSHIHITP